MDCFFYLPSKMYKLTLTQDEYNAWDFFTERGYAPTLPDTEEWVGDKLVYKFTESMAWDFNFEWQELGEAAGTCMSDKLKLKVWDLLEEIV